MSSEELESKFNLIDKAAKKSDRWWFLALLIIGIGWSGWIQYDNRLELAKRDARIEALHDRQAESGIKMAEVLAQNTKALEESTRVLNAVATRLDIDKHLARP